MNPKIQIHHQLAIGYRRKPLKGQKADLRLAEATSDIQLESGRHLLLARNGRGKTTLLKTLAGLLPALDGRFVVDGQIQYVDEELRFDPELTSKQIFKAFFTNGLLERALGYAERLELDVKKPYGKLSKGNRQKVTLVLAETRASDGKGQVMLLDEPFSGLDFHVRDEVDAIWRENSNGVVRLVCVHPDEPTLQAESAIVINDGAILQMEVDGALDWFETRKSLN
ncbi:MAG: ATP-binding cassette domain-containing protein [Verrucomicrobiae bacterium]|nr:ATP-binding cassette domain-containing protein [Verrucomicrobiae bacterium]MCB1090895.1 ATP-binding cassette domain-containing protein [Verrucomicrobiae bacterium]